MLTLGAEKLTCTEVARDVNCTTVTAIACWAPVPHAVLHCNEEWEIQKVPVHDVSDNDMRKDADAWPYIPATRSMELPVEARILGRAPLIKVATGRSAKGLLTADTLDLRSCRETINEELPVRCGKRKAIAVSDAHKVAADADA